MSTVAAAYEDRTPEDIFIKVYPAKLRRLIREHGLHRAEIGELILLALRIDDNNICWPSKQDSVASVGMKSARWARKLQARLKKKGVLDWDFDHDKRSPRFRIPDAFYFGRDSYRSHEKTPSRVRNTDTSLRPNTDPSECYNTAPEQDPLWQEPTRSKPSPNRQTDSLGKGLVPSATLEQQRLTLQLSELGVHDLEAYLISQQYSQQTIHKVIEDCRRHIATIQQPGAWVRRTLELVTRQPLSYTCMDAGHRPTAVKQLRVAAGLAVAQARLAVEKDHDPYFDNAYFHGRNNGKDAGTDNLLSEDDTTPETDSGDSRHWRFNNNGEPVDPNLPF